MSCAVRNANAHARRYAIYARSAAGDDGAASVQERSARAFLERYRADADAVQVYMDGPGAGAPVERPGLCALVRDAVDGQIDTLVVHDRACLAPGADLPGLLAALDAANVAVVLATAASSMSPNRGDELPGEG